MASQKERHQAIEHIVSQILPIHREGIKSCDEWGILFADQKGEKTLLALSTYPEDNAIAAAQHRAQNLGAMCIPIFYADGKNYFRPVHAVESRSKRDLGLSMYSDEDYKKMISLRKLELDALAESGCVFYYQSSEETKGGIVGYRMNPVTLNFSHAFSGDPRKSLDKTQAVKYKIPQELIRPRVSP